MDHFGLPVHILMHRSHDARYRRSKGSPAIVLAKGEQDIAPRDFLSNFRKDYGINAPDQSLREAVESNTRCA
nr:B55 [uncultured bacterium]